MKTKIIFAMAFLGNTLLFGQTGIVKGKIIDSKDREDMAFANVQLDQNGKVISKAVADIDGNYSFTKLAPGKYEMKTAYVGYRGCDLSEIIVNAERPAAVDVEMEMSDIIICDFICFERGEIVTESSDIICCFPACRVGDVSIVNIDSAESEKKLPPQITSDVECKVYPNPFMDYAVLEITSGMNFKWGSVQLFDLSGKKAREMDFSQKQVVIDRQGLSAGTYVYQVSSENSSIGSGRIIIQ